MILLTTFDQDEIVLAALCEEVNGFLSQTVSPAELVAGIAEVVVGGCALSAAAAAAALVDKEPLEGFQALTSRERDMVVVVASGLDNREIAARMSVSLFTVKTCVVRALTKVGTGVRLQLVTFTFWAGLYP